MHVLIDLILFWEPCIIPKMSTSALAIDINNGVLFANLMIHFRNIHPRKCLFFVVFNNMLVFVNSSRKFCICSRMICVRRMKLSFGRSSCLLSREAMLMLRRFHWCKGSHATFFLHAQPVNRLWVGNILVWSSLDYHWGRICHAHFFSIPLIVQTKYSVII